uniref:EGF-like domain-containing protein n=1 Tax=Salmo trutta TaxID=8032 RepID=A0A674DDU4_SALTR
MNLWEVADFLKGQGVNAINLDGGGSSTYVANGSLAMSQSPCGAALGGSPPSCVHQCQPEDCSGYGRASMGTANARRAGVRLASQPTAACGAHGVCTQDGCVCDAGWRGENCSQVCNFSWLCDLGFYGDGCNQTCTCANGGSCDPVHGGCSCPIGFHGDSCEQGVFIHGCVYCYASARTCDPVTGSCNALFQGEKNQSIQRYGTTCNSPACSEHYLFMMSAPQSLMSTNSFIVVIL